MQPNLQAPPQNCSNNKIHLDQEKKNLRSTKLNDPLDIFENIDPKKDKDNTKTGGIVCLIIDYNDIIYKIYSDQTGNIPVKKSTGNQYISSCIILTQTPSMLLL